MSRKLTVGSLFSGIGGIDLGLQRAGMEIRWHSEIDPYASRVLAKHWPGVPNHGDITRIDFAQVEPVDVLAGGFPCQDISSAGNKEGIGGKRSGLWSEYARAIGDLRPRYVFVENVADLLVRGLDRVLGDLAALGYDAEWHCIPAAAVGAPHLRDRLWLVTFPNPHGHLLGAQRHRQTGRSGARLSMASLHVGGLRHPGALARHLAGLLSGGCAATQAWAAGEPEMDRVVDGIPARLDGNRRGRLRGLGNAVVPQIPELIGGWIIEHARATGYLDAAA